MQSSRNSSVLRSLALSFGEGLAFSVGMKLTQNAIRPAAGTATAPDFRQIADKLGQIEQRMLKMERPREIAPPAPFDQKVTQSIVGALETRLQAHAGLVERRLTELESALAATIQTTVAQRVEEEAASLRAQMAAMNREFAEAVARAVAEQVAARAAALEPLVQERIEAAVTPLRAEIAEIRARLAETDSTIVEFVSAISAVCRKAADSGAAETAVSNPSETAAAPAPAEASPDLPVPGFAQAQKQAGGMWRVPVASSFLLALTAIGLLLHVL